MLDEKIKTMFNWLFKKKETCNVSSSDLSRMTANARGINEESNKWNDKQIEDFYKYKFLPTACERANSGYSCVDMYKLMGRQYNLTRYQQLRSYMRNYGFREGGTSTFDICW